MPIEHVNRVWRSETAYRHVWRARHKGGRHLVSVKTSFAILAYAIQRNQSRHKLLQSSFMTALPGYLVTPSPAIVSLGGQIAYGTETLASGSREGGSK